MGSFSGAAVMSDVKEICLERKASARGRFFLLCGPLVWPHVAPTCRTQCTKWTKLGTAIGRLDPVTDGFIVVHISEIGPNGVLVKLCPAQGLTGGQWASGSPSMTGE